MDFDKLKINKTLVLQSILLVAVIGGILWLARWAAGSGVVQQVIASFGYTGLFVVSVVSGFNVLFPVPVIFFLKALLASGFSLWGTILLISLGMSVGDTIGYLLGNTGRKVIQLEKKQNKILMKLEDFKSRYKILPLIAMFFYASFVPLPNELMVIPLAFMKYRLRFVFLAVLSGNFLFNFIAALGILGLT